MLRLRKFLPLAAVLLVGAAVLVAPAQASAAFSLTLADSDGNSVVINDNNAPLGSGVDVDPLTGRIVFTGSLGSFDIQISVGTSNAPGTPTLAQLTINNTSISSLGFTGSKTVTVTLQDTGFFNPTGKDNLESQVSTTQLPSNSTVTFQSYLNGVATGSVQTLTTVGGSRQNTAVNITTTPYSLKNVTTFTVQGQGANVGLTVQTSGLTAVTVPVPAGLVLVLTGAPLAGFGAWLRRRKKA